MGVAGSEGSGIRDQGSGVRLSGPIPDPRSLTAIRAAAGAWLATRAVVGVAAWVGVSELITGNPTTYHKGPFVEAALLWDAAWYAGIAQHGYVAPAAGATSNLAFPPLLPLLARGLGSVFQALGWDMGSPDWGPWALAGVVVSNGAFFAALVVRWHLVALDHPAAVASRTLWLVAAFPLGFFWSAFYTESLFLLLAVGCLYAARRGWWWPAGAAGGLATLTRWAGLLLAVVLLVEWAAARWRAAPSPRRPTTADHGYATNTRITHSPAHSCIRVRHSWSALPGGGAGIARPGWLALGGIALVPAALAGYLGWLQVQFGSPWGILQSQSTGWKHDWTWPWDTYGWGVSLLWQSLTQTGPHPESVLHWGYGNSLYMWLDLGLPWLVAGLGVIGWRRGWLRPGDVAWLVLGLLFPLSLGVTISLARYLLPLWPALVVAARLCTGRPGLERAWLVAGTGLMAVGAYLYASARWIG